VVLILIILIILNKMKMKLFNWLLIILLSGCSGDADPLTLTKKAFEANSKNLFLKTDGYYVEDDKDGVVFFLYKNGVFLDWGGVTASTNLERDSKIRLIDSLQYHKNTQYSWGLFEAETEDITIEKWLSGNGGPYPVEQFKGKILNDTTISIPFSYWPLDGSEKPRTFRFQKFSPKPDSTNMFIK
jgi:hypothetical protein